MKRIALLTLVLCASIASYSQFKQGRMLAGGTAAFNTSKINNSSTTDTKFVSFSVAPQFGYFIVDRMAIGAAVDFNSTKYKFASNANGTQSDVSIQFSPFIRYYLPLGIFFQGQLGIGSYKSEVTGDFASTNTYTVKSWGLSAGYALFLNDYVAIEPMLGYDANYYNNSVRNSGLFLKVGFQVYLGER